MSGTESIEIAPGMTLELDTSLWTFVDGYGIAPKGRDVQIVVDLRITSDATGTTQKAEGVIVMRTA